MIELTEDLENQFKELIKQKTSLQHAVQLYLNAAEQKAKEYIEKEEDLWKEVGAAYDLSPEQLREYIVTMEGGELIFKKKDTPAND